MYETAVKTKDDFTVQAIEHRYRDGWSGRGVGDPQEATQAQILTRRIGEERAARVPKVLTDALEEFAAANGEWQRATDVHKVA
jgi:hypothetical protein